MAIKFSPEIVQFLPQYLGLSIQKFVKVSNFKYSKMYLYNVISGNAVLNSQLNEELNLAWEKLGLEFEDLDNVYAIAQLVHEGQKKLKAHTDHTNKNKGEQI